MNRRIEFLHLIAVMLVITVGASHRAVGADTLHLVASGDTLLSGGDIARYDLSTRRLHLTELGQHRWARLFRFRSDDGRDLPRPSGMTGAPFELLVDDEVVARGRLTSMVSSVAHRGLTLYDTQMLFPDGALRLEFNSGLEEPDPRMSPALLDWFRRHDKLDDDLPTRLVAAAHARTARRVTYDGAYRAIPYPNGDVPDSLGVCTDVVIRAYRAVGIDLQRLVHEDMRADFRAYPDLWGLTRPDPNIDHRRVPNLQAFLRRRGAELPTSDDPAAYRPGDLVTWMLPGNLPHIGIVSDRRTADGRRPLIIHNIGRGPVAEDALLLFPITGHFRYAGP